MGFLPQSFKRLPNYDTPPRRGKDVVLLALTHKRIGKLFANSDLMQMLGDLFTYVVPFILRKL